MLTTEENELLARVGPETPMGMLLRRFWVPVLLAEELPEADCAPVRLRIMGENLVAFRDSEGRVGVIDTYCAHRRASLFWGRNEKNGLRCVYHGWKYDVTGQCVDMPNEPSVGAGHALPFKDKIKITGYPARDWGGLIWAYMGPPELEPELPQFEWARVPSSQRVVSKRLQESNWAQAVEGGIDSSHISFLHRRMQPGAIGADVPPGLHDRVKVRDTSPVFTVKNTDYGMLIGARRNAEEDSYYWRISQFLLPWYTMIPPVSLDPTGGIGGHAWVPIDDEHVWTYSIQWNPHRPNTEQELAQIHSGNGTHAEVDAKYRPIRNKDNDYLIDREAQRTVSFTGIKGIGEQDMAVQESMEPVVDRSKEHLGTSDTAIIAYRRLLLRLSQELQDGKEPAAATASEAFRVRSASLVLNRETEFDQGAAEDLLARV